MAGVNRVILLGNLGNDPDVRYTPDGKPITNITLATSEEWKDKNTGQKQSKTEWHRIVFFGGLAEVAGKYLHKGSKIYIEGKLQTRKWQDKSGQDKYTTEIVVDFGGTMQMLDSKSDNASQSTGQSQQQPAPQPQQSQPPTNKQAVNNMAEGFGEISDDIPFLQHERFLL